jgi:hypothetical protein
MSFGKVRLYAYRLPIGGNCFLELALISKSISETEEIVRIFCGGATLFAVHGRILT